MYKIMIVDDEELVRKGIAMEVNWKAIDCVIVAEAANGEEGLEMARKYSPDLIITDIRMPKMDGIEMVRNLRDDDNDVSVIFLTAYSDFAYAKSAIELYADNYLLKPFEDGELEAAVLRSVEKLSVEAADKDNDFLMLKKGDKSKYIMKAMDYIAGHYTNKDLSIVQIAEAVGVSEGHLSHVFKKETDYTIANYIIRFRMREAARMLKDCSNKVYEVADFVGYKDITYFSSTFKKVVGFSPSEYQDRCRK